MPGIRGGRDQFQEIVRSYYAKTAGAEKFKSVAAYADFRELLEKEKDIDCGEDHDAGPSARDHRVAAMKKGKHVLMHKPLANRMHEARLVIETARKTKVATHLLAYGAGRRQRGDRRRGSRRAPSARCGKSTTGPTGRCGRSTRRSPRTGRRFRRASIGTCGWGPTLDRPYHPNYTHMVFRGWYDFGGGSMADMGIYSLWPVFTALNLGRPHQRPGMVHAHLQYRGSGGQLRW